MEEPSHSWFRNFWSKLSRRKVIDNDMLETDLSRVLSPFSVVLIGIGQMAGGGAFVVLGTAALYAGPAVVVSFLIGGIVAGVTGMCYAEFAATIPKAGSGYLFSYVAMGEFVAFLVGWQVILENLISASSMASAMSGAVNSMTNDAVRNWTVEYIGAFHSHLLAPYPDLLALGAGLAVVAVMSCGANISTIISNVLNSMEVAVILFCIVACFCFADPRNWTFAGFAPNGFAGIMKGAAFSFFAFIGFESVACAGEETANPQKTVPMALFTSLGIMIVLYLLQAAALTLMVPYNKLDPQAAFPEAFDAIGYPGLGAIVAVGVIVGLVGSLLSNLYTTTRISYAMAQDGLLFSVFGKVNKRTKTPLFGELFFGCLAATLCVIFDLEILVEILSVGTLITYTIVAASSIVLHYQSRVTVFDKRLHKRFSIPYPTSTEEEGTSSDSIEEHVLAGTLKPKFRFLHFLDCFYIGFAIDMAIVLFAVFVAAFFSVFVYARQELSTGTAWAIILVVVFGLGFLAAYFVICAHQKRRLDLPYRIPFVPFIPALSIALNILLLSNLSLKTWLRFGIWLAAGLIIYFAYGIRYSTLASDERLLRRQTSVEPVADTIVRDPVLGITDMPAMDVDEKTPLLSRAISTRRQTSA